MINLLCDIFPGMIHSPVDLFLGCFPEFFLCLVSGFINLLLSLLPELIPDPVDFPGAASGAVLCCVLRFALFPVSADKIPETLQELFR